MPEPQQVVTAHLLLPDIREKLSEMSMDDDSNDSSCSSSSSDHTLPTQPSTKVMEARDSISSIDSDVSLSFDSHIPPEESNQVTQQQQRGASEADLSDSASDTGGKDSGCEVTPDIAEPIFTPPSDELADKIVQQVEFYFSDANITKDAFLLKHVKRNKEGYVSLKLISSFKRVKHITKDWRVVAHALARSTKLEINEAGTKLRRLHALPQYDETAPSRTVVSVHMPIEKPTIENVAELFRNCGEIALIRILRPGNPIPADVRQFINKNPSLGGMVCALVEFVESESARNALKLTRNPPAELKVYELNCVPHPERKKKVAGGKFISKNIRYHSVDSSDYTSCSEADVPARRRGGSLFNGGNSNRCAAAAVEPAAWLQRRLSASSTEACFRRLSYYSSSSRDSSDSNLFVPRRLSACNVMLDNHCCQPAPAQYYHHHHHPQYHPIILQQQQQQQQQQQFTGYYQRRMSACSSSSDCSGGMTRSRSNSAATFQPTENVLRLPRGPDGSRGFQGRVLCE